MFFVTVMVTLVNTVFLPFRCGTWLIASWRPTTLATMVTWTQWPFPLMAPSAPLVEGYERFIIIIFYYKFSCSVKLQVCSNDDISKDILSMIKRLFLTAAQVQYNNQLFIRVKIFSRLLLHSNLCYWIVPQIWFSWKALECTTMFVSVRRLLQLLQLESAFSLEY